ncbi:hypothetical protein K3757_05380 [Sulfitobacter sp. S223]|uniref:hypothetical protein n=1 Tax=Sulfitobacter sp. S223 TaxID=2867023 RepID=UPI0021A45F77|nr:hypothetical protein [Sulfitobacter sp. S223]UWR27373.1 hypothetical protein K3757_05380 [Sulfitobacter sp. S223]
MTRDRWMEDPKAVEEAEKVYAFIGIYVISFQWFEDKIDEIFTLGKGVTNSKTTLNWLVKKTFSDKIKAFHKFAIDDEFFRLAPQKDWYDELDIILKQLDEERIRRNGLLHSNFIFDFLAIGQPVISNQVKKENGVAQIHNHELSVEVRDGILQELADLSFRFSMVCMQLRNLAKNP